MPIDSITLEIVANRLEEIQRLMKQRLFRTGYSTILRESFDGSAGLTTADGRLIGASGASFHTIPYTRFVSWIIAHFGPDDIHPGDAFISNDPYKGGVAHTPDFGAAMPIFVDGKLVAFCTSMGHKPDVGGLAPSTASSAARSIFHEGIIVPPVKLYDRGVLNQALSSVLANNSRAPRLLLGDIEGQVGCMRVGAQLFERLCGEFSVDLVQEAMEALIVSSAKRLKARFLEIADGEAEVERWLDEDGASDRPIRVKLKLTKRGSDLRLDFSQSDPQCEGPANTVEQSVRASAIGAVLAFFDHLIPINDGVIRSIDIEVGRGRVVSPQWPAPVNSYTPGCLVVFNATAQALGQLAPERAFGDSGVALGGLGFGFSQPRAPDAAVQYEILPTGLGGTSKQDGAPMVFVGMIYETVQPIEIVETEYPIRMRDFSVRCDSGGAGEHRGGVGFCREWELLSDCHLLSRLSGRKFSAQGVLGGEAPPTARTVINPGRPDERLIAGLEQVHLKAGDVVRVEQSGGGGWGDPRHRSDQAVLDDVANGFVSTESAGRIYARPVERDALGRYAIARPPAQGPV